MSGFDGGIVRFSRSSNAAKSRRMSCNEYMQTLHIHITTLFVRALTSASCVLRFCLRACIAAADLLGGVRGMSTFAAL